MTVFMLPEDAQAWVDELQASLRDVQEAPHVVDVTPQVDALARRLEEAVATRPREQAPDARAGQIWTTRAPRAGGVTSLVLLTDIGPGGSRGVIVCDRVWIATTDDVVIPADASSAGSALVACLWREGPVDLTALADYVGAVDSQLFDGITMLLEHRRSKELSREPIGRVRREDVAGADEAAPRLLRWRIRSRAGAVRAYLTGPRLLSDDDPRAEAREAFYLATKHVEDRGLRQLEAAAEKAARTSPEPVEGVLASAIRRLREALVNLGAEIEDAVAFAGAVPVSRGGDDPGVAPSVGSALPLVEGDHGRSTGPVLSVPAAIPVPFSALVALGPVRVELQFDAVTDGFVVRGAAVRGEDEQAVAGVIVSLRVERTGGELVEYSQATEEPEGSFGPFNIPTTEKARASLRLSFEGVDALLEW